jgi:hypothetical protein
VVEDKREDVTADTNSIAASHNGPRTAAEAANLYGVLIVRLEAARFHSCARAALRVGQGRVIVEGHGEL